MIFMAFSVLLWRDELIIFFTELIVWFLRVDAHTVVVLLLIVLTLLL